MYSSRPPPASHVAPPAVLLPRFKSCGVRRRSPRGSFKSTCRLSQRWLPPAARRTPRSLAIGGRSAAVPQQGRCSHVNSTFLWKFFNKKNPQKNHFFALPIFQVLGHFELADRNQFARLQIHIFKEKLVQIEEVVSLSRAKQGGATEVSLRLGLQ